MSRSTGRLTSFILLVLALVHCAISRRINATIYDTNIEHVTYAPKDDFCIRWRDDWVFWRTCEIWAQPWKSQVYYNHGRRASMHRSLDHQLPSVTIKFQGSAIYIYGPPRSELSAIPIDYKICLHEDHRMVYEPVCYRVDIAEAYSTAEDFEAPVPIFTKGGLQNREHQVVISVGDPVDETERYQGIQFSHAVYTIERPTPWPVEEDHWRFREVVMHDTHPLLSYWPRVSTCTQYCWSSSGWTSKTYRAEDGTVESWHELTSHSEWNRDQWGVEATIKAGAVALYGVPKAHITDTDYLSYVCVQINSGHCEIVDVQHAYLNAAHHDESVLLWRNDALDPSQRTEISVRLVKTLDGSMSVFPFKAIHYYEPQEYASPSPPVGYVEDVVVAHDHEAIVYHPGRRCVNHVAWWCTKWFDPWVWREVGPSDSVLTYRSTVWSYRTTEDPSITLDFQGSAVYVYGAPKSFIKDPFASQHICINDVCHIVDVEQAYLNAPRGSLESAAIQDYNTSLEANNQVDGQNVTALLSSHPELEPVLIWSMTGLDDQAHHTLRLALAPLHSDDNAEMSIAKVAYTRISYDQGQSRPDTPVPPPDYGYEGPFYPPHATKWYSRGPPPPLPTPSRPPAPPPPPQRTAPPRSNPHSPWSPSPPRDEHYGSAFWIFASVVFITVVRSINAVLSAVSRNNGENRPIMPNVPPPAYAPQQPSPYVYVYVPPPRPRRP